MLVYAIAPANAVDEVREISDFITLKDGGYGAVREACEHLADLTGQSLLDAIDTGKRALVQ